MNKKISQFELTNTLYDQDLITVVQSNEYYCFWAYYIFI